MYNRSWGKILILGYDGAFKLDSFFFFFSLCSPILLHNQGSQFFFGLTSDWKTKFVYCKGIYMEWWLQLKGFLLVINVNVVYSLSACNITFEMKWFELCNCLFSTYDAEIFGYLCSRNLYIYICIINPPVKLKLTLNHIPNYIIVDSMFTSNFNPN